MNLKRLEHEENNLACKQLKAKISIQTKEIQSLQIEMTKLSIEKGDEIKTKPEYINLKNQFEEKNMLLKSLEDNLKMLLELEGMNSSEQTIINSKAWESSLFNIQSLPPVQREKVQSVIDEWPSRIEFPDILTYPQYKAVDELTRNSEFKLKAWNKGLIKPFLLLVSMHPEKRLRWAKSLNVPLLSLKNYGDSHAEAYKLLTMDRKGLQARANHAFADTLNPVGQNCNWYQILHRVCRKTLQTSKKVEDMKEVYEESRKTFDKSIEFCTNSDDKEICFLEEIFLKGVMQVMMFLLSESDEITLVTITKAMENISHTDARRYIQNLKSCGFSDDEVINFYVSAIIHGGENFFSNCLLNWAKSKEEGEAVGIVKMILPIVGMAFSALLAVPIFLIFGLLSPLILIPASLFAVNSAMYIWRETPGKLLNPLLVILMQDVHLALQGIRVQDFYPQNCLYSKDSASQIRHSVSNSANNIKGKIKDGIHSSFKINDYSKLSAAMQISSAPTILAIEGAGNNDNGTMEPVDDQQNDDNTNLDFNSKHTSAPIILDKNITDDKEKSDETINNPIITKVIDDTRPSRSSSWSAVRPSSTQRAKTFSLKK